MAQVKRYGLQESLQVIRAVFALICVISLACGLFLLRAAPVWATGTIAIPLTVENAVVGDTPATEEAFVFVLEAETDGAPMPSEAEISIAGAGSASFGSIDFPQAGQYRYRLFERAGSTTGYTYDTTVYQVLVDVSWQGGKLVTQVTAWKGEASSSEAKVSALAFENSYDEPPNSEVVPPDSTQDAQSNDGIAGFLTKTSDFVPIMLVAAIVCLALLIAFFSRHREN